MVIGLQALERFLDRLPHERRREVLLPLAMAARRARVAIEVVTDFPADLNLRSIDFRRLHPVAEHRLRPAIAVGVAVVEIRDAAFQRERAKPIAVLLRVMAPPVDAKDPTPQRDRRNGKAMMAKMTRLHAGIVQAGRHAGEGRRLSADRNWLSKRRCRLSISAGS